MSHYGHDMDRDGKITSKDSALFHEMMDGKKQCDAHYSKSTGDIFSNSTGGFCNGADYTFFSGPSL